MLLFVYCDVVNVQPRFNFSDEIIIWNIAYYSEYSYFQCNAVNMYLFVYTNNAWTVVAMPVSDQIRLSVRVHVKMRRRRVQEWFHSAFESVSGSCMHSALILIQNFLLAKLLSSNGLIPKQRLTSGFAVWPMLCFN